MFTDHRPLGTIYLCCQELLWKPVIFSALCLWHLVLFCLSYHVLAYVSQKATHTLCGPGQDLCLQVPIRTLQRESCALGQLNRATQTAYPLTLVWTRGIKCLEFVSSKYLISSSQPGLGDKFLALGFGRPEAYHS